MQKYPHIIELSSCSRKMLVFIFLLPGNSLINALISSGIDSTPKLSKKITSFFLQNKAIQCVATFGYSSRFII